MAFATRKKCNSKGEFVTPQQHALMPAFKILCLGGDHIGPEVVNEAVKVLRCIEGHPAIKKKDIQFHLDHDLLGGQSIEAHGIPLTPAVIDKAKKSHAVLFGAVGSPKWDYTGALKPETSVLELRKTLRCWANIRPCYFPSPGVVKQSPIKEDLVKGFKLIVCRENNGGCYFSAKVEEKDYASDVWGYSRWEIERIAKMSAYLARQHADANGPAKITSVDKANTLKVFALWRHVVEDVHRTSFPDIPLQHQLSDSLALLMIKKPTYFNGILLCDNFMGDLFSDQAAGIIGSLGFCSSASLSSIPGEGELSVGMYEPSHGSAPDLPPNRANPVATIQSAGLMLRYSCGLGFLADAIDQAISVALDDKEAGGLEVRTGDIGGSASCTEMGDAVVTALQPILDKML